MPPKKKKLSEFQPSFGDLAEPIGEASIGEASGFKQLMAEPEDDLEARQDYEGPPRYFDASKLPDAPGYQPVASGAQVSIIYIIFPTREQMVEGLATLTMGQRATLAPGVRLATIDATNPGKSNQSWLERWKDKLGQYATKVMS